MVLTIGGARRCSGGALRLAEFLGLLVSVHCFLVVAGPLVKDDEFAPGIGEIGIQGDGLLQGGDGFGVLAGVHGEASFGVEVGDLLGDVASRGGGGSGRFGCFWLWRWRRLGGCHFLFGRRFYRLGGNLWRWASRRGVLLELSQPCGFAWRDVSKLNIGASRGEEDEEQELKKSRQSHRLGGSLNESGGSLPMDFFSPALDWSALYWGSHAARQSRQGLFDHRVYSRGDLHAVRRAGAERAGQDVADADS